uniref:ATP synthase complex subunit 8 n=1 Tax=Urodontus glabratus TaxID=1205599 RepID=A0A0S2MSN2_9CUCU|nr:ATP synthase F0 subunit 8 [Urodontus glabratus]
MPQMAPLSWLTLFVYFSLIFFLFMFLNYYIFTYPSNKKTINLVALSKSWKW